MKNPDLIIDDETAQLIRVIAKAEDATPTEVLRDVVLNDVLRRRANLQPRR